MKPYHSAFSPEEYQITSGKSSSFDGIPIVGGFDHQRSLQHGLADGLRRLVLLCPPMRGGDASGCPPELRPQDGRTGGVKDRWLPEQNLLYYPDEYVQSTERHPMDHLSGVLRDRKLGHSRIGLEMDNYYFSASAYTSLLKHLPNASFNDATGLVNWCRAVKSEEEIEFMRRAARIVEHMHTRILDQVEPGMRKCDLVAEIYDASIRGTAEYGGDYPAIVPLLPSGTDAAASHLTWDDRPMKKGEATFFEIAGCYRRYHVPLCRTVFLGQPSREFLNADQAVQKDWKPD